MSWHLDGVRIFVQDHKRSGVQIIPRLQPLAGGTVHQFFGYESPVLKLSGLVVGTADKNAIEGMYIDHSSHALTGPFGTVNYYVHNVSISLEKAVLQSIRPDLDCEAPVYNIEMELYEVT